MHKFFFCTYAKFSEKKKSFFRKFFFATGLIFERFLAPRSRFFEKVNGLGVLGHVEGAFTKFSNRFKEKKERTFGPKGLQDAISDGFVYRSLLHCPPIDGARNCSDIIFFTSS
ncbi:hypothetical protein LXL04_016801 [Taraxacum kok-saghyz]